MVDLIPPDYTGFHGGLINEDEPRFHFRSRLGGGAEGQVYLADDLLDTSPTALPRPWAVKIIRCADKEIAETVRDGLFRELVVRLQGVHHEGIVACHEVFAAPAPISSGPPADKGGDDGWAVYLKMDYIKGPNLAEWWRAQGTGDLALALALVRDVCSTLDFLLRGARPDGPLIPCDIKPGNVIVTERSGELRAVLCDLTPNVSETEQAVMVSPCYAAPELLAGGPAGVPSVIYAVGALLWFVFARTDPPVPYDAARLRSTLEERIRSNYRTQSPEDPASSVLAAMAANPGERPATASEAFRPFAPAIGASRTAPASVARRSVPSEARRRRPLAVLRRVGVVMAVTLIAGAIGLAWPRPPASGAPLSVPFVAEQYGDLAVNRLWTLVGGSRLEGTVTLVNSAARDLSGLRWEEVIPKQAAASVADITFSPTPGRVVSADPVVEYMLPEVKVGQGYTFTYVIRLLKGKHDRERLLVLERAQLEAQSEFRTARGMPGGSTLNALSIDGPNHVQMKETEQRQIKLVGTMSDGTAPSEGLFSGLAWKSADENVATVQSGVVTAVNSGSTIVSVASGNAHAEVLVEVIDLSATSGTTAPNVSAGVGPTPQIPGVIPATTRSTAAQATTRSTTAQATTRSTSPATAPPATAPPATAPAEPSNDLFPGDQLSSGQTLWSPTSGYSLGMQGDGNLVVRAPGNRPVWSSGTNIAGSVAVMQGDGNLVVVAPGNRAVWSSGTVGHPGSVCAMQDDGNFVVIAPGNVALWSTNTRGK